MENLYNKMYVRNWPIVSKSTQEKILELKILVAGCGSTGGAFIEGASRLGVVNYTLAEPDTFELHNLNRQFVYPEDIGTNKAEVHAKRLKNLFSSHPHVVSVEKKGIQKENIDHLLFDQDVVFDAVDVTTEKGMAAKLLLHERAAAKKIIVISALDLGFKQWIRTYNYQNGAKALDGKLNLAKACQHPLKALVEGFCALDDLSLEIAIELQRLLDEPGSSACQIGSACHLLAAYSAPILIRIAEKKSLPELIQFDLMRSLETDVERQESEIKRQKIIKNLRNSFSNLH